MSMALRTEYKCVRCWVGLTPAVWHNFSWTSNNGSLGFFSFSFSKSCLGSRAPYVENKICMSTIFWHRSFSNATQKYSHWCLQKACQGAVINRFSLQFYTLWLLALGIHMNKCDPFTFMVLSLKSLSHLLWCNERLLTLNGKESYHLVFSDDDDAMVTFIFMVHCCFFCSAELWLKFSVAA